MEVTVNDMFKEMAIQPIDIKVEPLKMTDIDTLQPPKFETGELIRLSAKLIRTIEILKEIQKKDEKAIIFTDRKDMQRMLAKVCEDKFGIAAPIINGETPVSVKGRAAANPTRQECIKRFQNKKGFNIIIM
ncbi:SNF2-like protein, partial [Candidatus Magnetoovum chiemensis]